MKHSFIREKIKAELKNPILIEGLPGLGSVGKIVVTYLIKQLDAKKFAELYSPFFPYHVVVNKRGGVRLLRGEFYYWKGKDKNKGDIIFFTGDNQAQTIDGQYEMVNRILTFVKKLGVKTIVTIGGYCAELKEETPHVISVATNKKLLKQMLKAGAETASIGNPIVGAAGLFLGLARFQNMEAVCLLGETIGYMPDPRAAKSILEVLKKALELEMDLSRIEREIKKSKDVLQKMRGVEKTMKTFEEIRRKDEAQKLTYIS